MKPIHCDWCQRATREIGDCGYCRDCGENRCRHKGCQCFAPEAPNGDTSQRWQIRGRAMARFIDELAPLNDATALGFLRGAVEEGWVTEAQVSIPGRAAACGER